MRPATARAIVVAAEQRAQAERKTRRRSRMRTAVGVTGLGLIGLTWSMPFTMPKAYDAYYRYQERQVFEEQKAKGGWNPYTGYLGPEAFDEPWENVQP